MEKYPRRGESPFRNGVETKYTRVVFGDQSSLEILSGYHYSQFRLKVSNDANNGWVMSRRSLEELIAELLYIREDIKNLEQQERNQIPFLIRDPEEDDDEEEEDDGRDDFA